MVYSKNAPTWLGAGEMGMLLLDVLGQVRDLLVPLHAVWTSVLSKALFCWEGFQYK